MTSTIKVNNVQNQCGQNIINENSNTITIGASGDTIALASGASQTGFGRSGSVNWQTTIKTGNFSASDGEGYFVNTTSGAITASLPAGSVGAIVAFKDYAGTFQTNNLTISPNGTDKIDSVNGDAAISTENAALVLVFADSTRGWLNVNDSTSVEGTNFITATGGTIATCGNFKVHTFTGPGTFCVSVGAGPLATVDYLVVAGGGGGGSGQNGSSIPGAGGGGGGFRVSNSYCLPAPTMSPLSNSTGLPVSVQGYPIVVGGGGAGSAKADPGAVPGTVGSNSSFSSITSAGGGAGGGRGDPPTPQFGGDGGSGGGSAGVCNTAGGTGNTPTVSPPQGNPGGRNATSPGTGKQSGGGGGAGAAGGDGNPGPSLGGVGSFVSPSLAVSCAGTPGPVGSTRYFSGGGGVGVSPTASPTAGGSGGGGAGAAPGCAGTAGTTNTGGGGGSGNAGVAGPGISAAGGSGIVIIRYKFQ